MNINSVLDKNNMDRDGGNGWGGGGVGGDRARRMDADTTAP